MNMLMNLHKNIIAVSVAVAIAAVGSSGCTNIRDDSTRTKTEGTLTGAAGGAAVGALLGNIIGGNTKGTLVGAAIGAGVGSLAGFFVGKHVADKKAEYAKREDWLDDCIAHARQVSEESRNQNAQLKKEISALDSESKKLRTAYKKKQVEKSQLAKEQRDIKKLQEQNLENIKALEEEVKKQQVVARDARDNGNKREAELLDKEIKKLNAQIKEMKAYNSQLASISSRLAV
ncbi:MAG: YMGG-like glycine zipper-containing protein [Succinimonas sp.]|nr:YMGG-like glycine zipper-containing protein [Succinimonas sp.]